MTRLVLLIIFGLLVSYYFPDSRRMLVDKSRPLWIPIVEWNTKQEMKQVASDVVDQERLTGQLPDRRHWKAWLEYRYSLQESWTDGWGSMYDLEVWPDSVGIISYGPDRTRGTDDDFVVTQPRIRVGRQR